MQIRFGQRYLFDNPAQARAKELELDDQGQNVRLIALPYTDPADTRPVSERPCAVLSDENGLFHCSTFMMQFNAIPPENVTARDALRIHYISAPPAQLDAEVAC